MDLNTSAPEQQSQETGVPTGGSRFVQTTPGPQVGKINETPLSPYVQSDDSAWNQSQLAKVLLTLKDSDVKNLTFTDKSYKQFEYEKWKMAIDRTMKGLHPEIGKFWEKISKNAEEVYFKYLKDLSPTRVSLVPTMKLDETDIETRIENRIKNLVMNAAPESVANQCTFQEDLMTVQILYRIMIASGPASKEDRTQMQELLTNAKRIDVEKLYEHLVMWKFARNRLKKYGFQEPDASQLFETLKAACQSMVEKDEQFGYNLRNFIMNHSSVNGLVDLTSVTSLYDMILDNSRIYSGQPPTPKAAATNASEKNRTRKGKKDQGQTEKN